MNHPSQRRTVSASIAYGELDVSIEADGVYSPDGIHDLVGQVIRGFNEALSYLRAHGMVNPDGDEIEDDDE